MHVNQIYANFDNSNLEWHMKWKMCPETEVCEEVVGETNG